MREEEIKAAVEASPLLGGCNLSVSGMQVKYCHKGQIVSDRQKNEEILGLIMEGSMDVYSIALDGREILLSQLERGDCFGVVNLLTKTELPTVLRCRTDTTLVIIPKCQLFSAMEKNSELALRYAGFCNRKMQFLIRRIEFLTMQSGRKKLVQYLLEVPGKGGRFGKNVSRDELASILGISRASLFRELAGLTKQGLIALRDGEIYLLKPDELEEILYA
ncbi:MAG: Crp/Fnr family transcriptional regulator [Clostridium sp.]